MERISFYGSESNGVSDSDYESFLFSVASDKSKFMDDYGEYDEDKYARIRRILNEVVKNELTEAQHVVVHLFFYQRKPVTKIAEELGVTGTTVYKNLARAKENIKKIMKYVIL